MTTKLAAALLLCLIGQGAAAGTISSISVGTYTSAERAILAPAFIDAVGHYLKRYDPTVVERSDTHVKMLFVYDVQYAAELHVTSDKDYAIEVTLVENAADRGQARRQAVALVLGVQRNFKNFLQRPPRPRSKLIRAAITAPAPAGTRSSGAPGTTATPSSAT